MNTTQYIHITRGFKHLFRQVVKTPLRHCRFCFPVDKLGIKRELHFPDLKLSNFETQAIDDLRKRKLTPGKNLQLLKDLRSGSKKKEVCFARMRSSTQCL